jgi:hypothetical protein
MRFARSSEYSRTTVRHLLVDTTLHDLGLADRSSRCSRLLRDRVLDTPSLPLVNFAPLQSLTHGRPSREATPLMRFGAPLTLEVTRSDQHRGCLTRLCSAFRLSQPLDALLLSTPFRLCFTPVAPVGFLPSEVFPPMPPMEPLGPSAPHDVVAQFDRSAPSPVAVRKRAASIPGKPCRSDVDPVRSGARSSGPEMPSRARGCSAGLPRDPCGSCGRPMAWPVANARVAP